jgi:hypothetical protein
MNIKSNISIESLEYIEAYLEGAKEDFDENGRLMNPTNLLADVRKFLMEIKGDYDYEY